MVSRPEMDELVKAHANLDEPMDTAIWIRRDDRVAWLVELIPTLSSDDHPERPIEFNPGLSFRHPLNLIASNREGLHLAFEADRVLARDVADGEILHGQEFGKELQAIAYGYAQGG